MSDLARKGAELTAKHGAEKIQDAIEYFLTDPMSDDDEVLARVLRRFLVGDEYWRVGENELLLDGTVEVSDEETVALAEYRR